MSRALLLSLLALLIWGGLSASAQARSLKLGDSGQDVANTRASLKLLGYLPTGKRVEQYDLATMHAVIAFQKWERLARDGVAGPATRARLRRAVRPIPSKRSGSGRRIEVRLDKQLALLVSQSGRVERTISISSGQPGYSTPRGNFRVFRKELMSWSRPYKVWMPLASYFVGGVAFHAYPSVPVYPASHGCVRVPLPFARSLYRFASPGTRVVVL